MSWVGGEGALHVLFGGCRGSELTRDSGIKRGLAALGAGVLSPGVATEGREEGTRRGPW